MSVPIRQPSEEISIGRDGEVIPSLQQKEVEENGAVQRAAIDRLRQGGHWGLAGVVCQYDRGLLVLSGRVPSDHVKTLARDIVSRLGGVILIDNQLEVT